MQLKRSENLKESHLVSWKPVKSITPTYSPSTYEELPPQGHSCSWGRKSVDLPDIEACNVVWDSEQQRSTQLVNTCLGVIHAKSTHNSPLFVCGENVSQAKSNSNQTFEQQVRTSICLRRRRLSNNSMERHVRDRLLAEVMSRTTTPVHDCDYWIDRSSTFIYLTEVDLSRNRLTQLPDCVIKIASRIKVLNLSHNRFTSFPEQLSHLTNLKVLDLSHNMISGGLPEDLPRALTRLKVLRLYGNQITELPGTLGECTLLETLVLGSIFGGNLLQSFPEKCISRLVNLKELDLTQNQLVSLPSDIGHSNSNLERLAVGENRLLSLPSSIGLCRLLRSLDLSRNSLLDLPIEITDLHGLETLDLTENKLCVIPGDIALFMSKTTVLLSGNPFTLGIRKHGPTHEVHESTTQISPSLIQQLQSTSEQHLTPHCTRPNSPVPSNLDLTPDNHTIAPFDSTIHPSCSRSLPGSSDRSSLLPSLREFAARKILKYAIPIPSHRVPISLLRYLERGARPCCHCLDPYVREWISCVEVKNYLGHPKVPRSIRFCSTTCMLQTKNPRYTTNQATWQSNKNSANSTQDQQAKAPIKPFSSLLTQRSNQPSIKSKKPSTQRSIKRMIDQPITTDW